MFKKALLVCFLALTTVAMLPREALADRTLNIKFDRQDAPLSCEVAALKMALAFHGIRVSESTLMSHVRYHTTARRGRTWGDPNLGFVGRLHGRQNTTGYGVHWFPIARAAKKYRPNSIAYTRMTVQGLARNIDNNRPAVIWGTYRGTAYYDPWYTPSGKLIKAWFGEHTRVVMGYRGTAQNPTHFILLDPVTGKLTWTTDELKKNWARFNNAGVVVQ